MTRRSTASSSTDPTAADGGRAAAQREAAERATRRQFFRLFGRQTVNGAGSVLAGVAALRATGEEALGELLSPTDTSAGSADRRPLAAPLATDEAPAVPAADALRSPYRIDGDALLILDQRELPARVVNLRCHDASEVMAAIRTGALGAGPVLAQVAAYTLVLAATGAADRSAYARGAALGAAADTLRAARPISRALAFGVEAVLAAAEAAEGDGTAVAAAIRAAADVIAMEAALDHARLGQLAAAVLAGIEPRDPAPAGRRVALLMHGDMGPLAGGMVGPGFAIVQSLARLGRPSHAWLTDGAPLMEGRRAAWQLEQLDVPHTGLPDAGAGWLLEHRRVDAVLLRAEWVAANGDTAVALGGPAIARAAREREVPVYAVAPTMLLDRATTDGSAMPGDLRVPSREAGGPRLDPAADIVPAALLDGILTEDGLVAPPFGQSISAALERRAARRSTSASMAAAG